MILDTPPKSPFLKGGDQAGSVEARLQRFHDRHEGSRWRARRMIGLELDRRSMSELLVEALAVVPGDHPRISCSACSKLAMIRPWISSAAIVPTRLWAIALSSASPTPRSRAPRRTARYPLGVCDAVLGSGIGVGHQAAGRRLSQPRGHLQGVDDQARANVRGQLPADDHARRRHRG